ncbi:hypothetical protein EYZ11_010761 [Aspergillus tanneri]|uniref:ATP-grasp domain-containing protein n=1 Tax=Aspergillus tanneri TaxID=1220188 RepID=A0A4S3J4I2_9EURO|nr:hypothetical protein EYZ11_010761 [Aspergillus tanneri]
MVLRSPSMPIHQRSFPRSIIMNNPAVERFLLQAISRVRSGVPIGFHLLLPVSIGYVSRNIPGVIVTEALNQVRTAIANRLSFRWLLLDPVQSCRLAMVEESFVPFDTNVDAHFGRLTQALEALRVDGIVTRNDRLVRAVAVVAEAFGFPTSPAAAFETATNKYATRLSEIERGLCVSGPSDLQEKLHPSNGNEPIRLQYPLVVKPCEGDRSHYLSKDGEILFCEVSDDFPSDADSPGATIADTFQETAFAHPSRLTSSEQDLLRQALLGRILHMGFRSGVFHVEARVRYSVMKYVEENGTLDLHYNMTRDEKQGPKPRTLVSNPNSSSQFRKSSLVSSASTFSVVSLCS